MLPFYVKFIIVMCSMILADVCWTMYFIEVDKRRPVMAGAWSACIVLFGAFTTVGYVHDPRLLTAAIIGAFIGTYGTIIYKNKKEKK